MLALADPGDHRRRQWSGLHHYVRALDAAQISDHLDKITRSTHEAEAPDDHQNISARRLQARLNIPGRSPSRFGS